jgi:hypothetical protein
VKSWALNVAGGGLLVEIAANSPTFGHLLDLAAGANFGLVQNILSPSHPLVNLVQTIVDPHDPLNYASLMVMHPRTIKGMAIPPRNILQIQVVYDELVSNEGNEALARAGGWGYATPNVGSNSGILDYKNLANDHSRVPLADGTPDGTMFFHDTPVMGTTAILVQSSPGVHGSDFVASTATRRFGIPYADFDAPDPWHLLDISKQFKVRCPYRELQASVVQFFDGTFKGQVPVVNVGKAPIRDLDDDGALDDVDRDPANPNVQ